MAKAGTSILHLAPARTLPPYLLEPGGAHGVSHPVEGGGGALQGLLTGGWEGRCREEVSRRHLLTRTTLPITPHTPHHFTHSFDAAPVSPPIFCPFPLFTLVGGLRGSLAAIC